MNRLPGSSVTRVWRRDSSGALSPAPFKNVAYGFSLCGLQAHALVRHDDPVRRQQTFDHMQAERKTKIEPHGVDNHFSRKPVAAIKAVTSDLGHAERSHSPIADRLTLRCRDSEIMAALDMLLVGF